MGMNSEAEQNNMTLIPQLKLRDKSVFDQPSDGRDIWTDDISGKRKNQAKSLEDLIVAQSLPCTICLNAGWGSGKTFFLTRFVEEYKRVPDGGPDVVPTAIYYNAWKDDFIANPLLSIVAQLIQTRSLSRFRSILDDIKKASMPLLAHAGLAISKGLAKGLLKKVSSIDADEITNALNLSLGDVAALSQKSLYDSYKEQGEARDFLRTSLEKLSVANWNVTHRPLVMVVDELDRCRPTFAIELLERIKHLFDVPYLVFVIGMDEEQLKKSLKSVYGDIDAQNYLLKFIDVETTLPPLSTDEFIVSNWINLGFEHLTVPGSNSVPVFGPGDDVLEDFKCLVRINSLTLRQIEQCMRLFFFLARPYAIARSEGASPSPELLTVGMILKIVDSGLYTKMLEWELSAQEILDAVMPTQTEMGKWSKARSIAGAIYKMACAQNPMGVFRQNLTNYAKEGKVRVGSTVSDFALPRCIESLPPLERQKFFWEISEDLKCNHAGSVKDGKEFNDQRVGYLDGIREESLKLMKNAFQIASL